MGNKSYEYIIKQTRAQRDQLLESQIKIIEQTLASLKLTPEKIQEIASLTVVKAVQALNSGKLTSQELLTVLAYRTIKIGKELNLFTYLYYEKSLQTARKCDDVRKETKKKNITLKQISQIKLKEQYENYLPPLYGIPISIKDVYHLQGKLATLGLSVNANKTHEESPLIKCFRNAGMIPFVQTNVPQFGMTFETGNFLWGRSRNPWNKDRSVGGSSGGEGAMISSRCSILGVGSDIGGSIRIPSQHCGVFGLKCSSKRISNSYHACLSKAFESFARTVPNCLGPLGRSAEDLALFMTVATHQQYYGGQQDPYIKIIPFDASTFLKTRNPSQKYRIGYFKSLKDIQPSLASQRAHEQILQILSKQGHELVQIEIPNQRQIIREFINEYMSVGGQNYKQMLSGQKPVADYRTIFLMGGLRAPGRFILSNIAKWFMPRTYFYFLQQKPYQSIFEYQKHRGQIAEMRSHWAIQWKKMKVDFIIAPGFGCQALPHEKSEKLGLASAYTYIWNVLDMAVAAIPVTLVREDQERYESKFQDLLTKDLKIVAEGSKGLPVGIQIVGLPYKEEKVLGLMSYLEQKVKFYEKFGYPKVDNQN